MEKPALTAFTPLVRGKGLVETKIDGEIVGLHIELGNCYGMNLVATRIWELLATPHSVQELCGKLIEEYSIDPGTCELETLVHCERLVDEGLVHASN